MLGVFRLSVQNVWDVFSYSSLSQQVRGREKFLVRWKGYTAEEDTWESRENLENTKELVEEFEKEHGEKVEELRR